MRVHLLDGTYELFRHYFAVPKHQTTDGAEVGALRGVLNSVLWMFDEGATHLAVATDHVIESFRNDLWRGYKTSAGIETGSARRSSGRSRTRSSDGRRRLGDDRPRSRRRARVRRGRSRPRTSASKQVLICTPDKDIGQCVVGDHVVQFDRRKRELRNEDGVFDEVRCRPGLDPRLSRASSATAPTGSPACRAGGRSRQRRSSRTTDDRGHPRRRRGVEGRAARRREAREHAARQPRARDAVQGHRDAAHRRRAVLRRGRARVGRAGAVLRRSSATCSTRPRSRREPRSSPRSCSAG